MAYESDMKDEKKKIKLKCREDYLKIKKIPTFWNQLKVWMFLFQSMMKKDTEKKEDK